ncbi:MAG: hypothetical protein ABI868_05150 [Acidobacteriota bacterium]
MTTTRTIVTLIGLALASGPGLAAQTADARAYLDLNVAGQTQSVTLATSSAVGLFDELATTSTSQTVGKGLLFDGGAGYRVRPNLTIGIAVSLFNRAPVGTIVATIPDPLVYGRFSSVGAAPKLTHTELGTHVKVGYVKRVSDTIDLAISGGPSFIRLTKDIASATIANGGAQITVGRQTGTAVGVNAGIDLGYFFTRRLGGGIFARYVAAKADLPAAAGVSVGGFQGGLGLRVRF